jgi:hypothetical protein
MPQRNMAHEIAKEETLSFKFPIRGSNEDIKMKNIHHLALSNFHGLSKEYLDTFLFEFDMLCRTHDYISYAQKLKLFLFTLNNVILH